MNCEILKNIPFQEWDEGGCLEKDTGPVLSPETLFLSKQMLFMHFEYCSTCIFFHITSTYNLSSAKDGFSVFPFNR